MNAQRQLAVAAVRAEVRRHEVTRQALSCLRKLAERVSDPELRDSIQTSVDRIRGKRRISSHLGCIGDQQGHIRACWSIQHFPISHFLVPKMELGLWGKNIFGKNGKRHGRYHSSSFPNADPSPRGSKYRSLLS